MNEHTMTELAEKIGVLYNTGLVDGIQLAKNVLVQSFTNTADEMRKLTGGTLTAAAVELAVKMVTEALDYVLDETKRRTGVA